MITDQDSSDQQRFLFQSDLNRFWEVVANDDPTARLSALENLDDLLLVEAVRYGVFNKQEMIGPLAQFYRDPIMQMSEDRRFAVYRHVAGFVEHTSSVSTNSFLPFITEDNSRRIVSSAVIDYVSLGPISNDDPMSRVRDIVGMIESNMLQNEGAAFGALLHIGDKRVCDLLIPLRDSLDHDAMNNAVHSGTGFIHSATVDFYLDWLEGMEGIDQDGAFGIVASGLGLLKRKSRIDQVSTGNRPFPVRNVSPEQWQALQRPIPLAKYVQRVSRRMHALERAEPPPRVMPHVLTAWGLKPLTDPAEAAVLDDRAATTTAGFESEIIPGGRIAEVKGEWWDGEGSIYLTWGILNPNGPTLYVLGSREFDGKYRTFMRWLHMFGGCTAYAAETVDEITYQGIYDDANSIHEHLVENDEPGLFHVIPSFLIANGGDETLATIAKHLLAGGTAAKEDWGQSMAYNRQFGSDFFTRSATEIRATYESLLAETRAKGEEPPSVKFIEHRFGHLPDFQNAKIPSWTETPMTPELLEEWWQVISPRDFQVNALTTLRIMWEGAPKMLPDDARANVVPWEAVIRFLEGYGLRLPND